MCSRLRGVSRWFAPLACGPGSPELSKAYLNMASELFTFTFTLTFTCAFTFTFTCRFTFTFSIDIITQTLFSRDDQLTPRMMKSTPLHHFLSAPSPAS